MTQGARDRRQTTRSLSRREFVGLMGTAAAGLISGSSGAGAVISAGNDSFVNLLRPPDAVAIVTDAESVELRPAGRGRWEGAGVEIAAVEKSHGLRVQLNTPNAAVKRIHLHWRAIVRNDLLVLGDQWERAYGDLHWGAPDPARVMPWYFMTFDGAHAHGYGVMTLPAAFCHWQTDADGFHLWADVRSGGVGVKLGARRLDVCDVVCRRGADGETPFQAARALCHLMSPKPRLLSHRVFGTNNWYYAYGKSDAGKILQDAQFIAALSPGDKNRPYCVIDDGWQLAGDTPAGFWGGGNGHFPSMPGLARDISKAGAKPGIWIRPLIAAKAHPPAWRLSRNTKILDPTIPGVREQVRADIARMRDWGFELVKHDYSTYDITGRWGSMMKATITNDGWAFASRHLTTAEVVVDLYRVIREAAGKTAVLGCNTVGHLSAGFFELSRIGDDTSGREWSRTRQMGVNCLAFRAPQHETFYAADADCVGMTSAGAIPWAKNRQWLDLLARSGTPVFISLNRESVDAKMENDLRAALAIAALPQPPPEPLDWLETPTPARWRLGGRDWTYDWS